MCPRPRPHRRPRVIANGQNFREVGLHQCPSERKGEGVPVRSPHVPSHVPGHPQTAAKVRGFSLTASGFTAETDWLLEESGFELMVPPRTERKWEGAGTHQHHLGRASELKVPLSLSFLISLRTRGIRSSIPSLQR
jgi:hypothetical protein